jgi:lactoylglutathione lyase
MPSLIRSLLLNNDLLPSVGYVAMTAKLLTAWGYQGDAMNLPVADVVAAVPYYERVMAFSVVERSDEPQKRVVLERDDVRMALNENGGDPSQDGVAFHVEKLGELFGELEANGWKPPPTRSGDDRFETEDHGEDGSFKVFYMIAPDGLCFWFGEKQ